MKEDTASDPKPLVLICPMCESTMKDQIYIDYGIEHGSFYCPSVECHMPPIVFRGRAEHKAIKAKLVKEDKQEIVFSQGVLDDGAVFLKDGKAMTVEEVLDWLRR